MIKINPTVVAIGVGVLAVIYIGYKVKKATTTAVQAINPVDRENVIYSGVNAIVDYVGDGDVDDSFSLGSWIYDVTHPEENKLFQ